MLSKVGISMIGILIAALALSVIFAEVQGDSHWDYTISSVVSGSFEDGMECDLARFQFRRPAAEIADRYGSSLENLIEASGYALSTEGAYADCARQEVWDSDYSLLWSSEWE